MDSEHKCMLPRDEYLEIELKGSEIVLNTNLALPLLLGHV